MSHALGAIRTQDGVIKFFEYDGTSDICLPVLRDTIEEVSQHWRSPDNINFNPCGHEGIEGVIYSDYGGGFYWNGLICLDCPRIIEPVDPYYDPDFMDTITDGVPDGFTEVSEE